jgi:hypothetical protein
MVFIDLLHGVTVIAIELVPGTPALLQEILYVIVPRVLKLGVRYELLRRTLVEFQVESLGLELVEQVVPEVGEIDQPKVTR